MTAEELVLAATAFLSGLASGLLGMLSAIMRPMLAAMGGRDFRSFMEAFLRYADHSLGKVFNEAWSHLGDEVRQVLQRVLEVVGVERRELEVLAHVGRDR